MSNYFICPNCEAKLKAGARVCPECGADEQAGWGMRDDDLELPSFGRADAPSYEPDPEDELLRELDRQGQAPAAARPGSWLIWVIVTLLFLSIISLPLLRTRLGLYAVPALLIALAVAIYLGQGKPLGSWQERRLYRELLDRARGDKELVERVIELERRRNPWESRAEHMRAALYRWTRDRK